MAEPSTSTTLPRLSVVITGDQYGRGHADYLMKNLSNDYDVTLIPCRDGERYAALAEHAALNIKDGTYDKGIFICGTGMGVCLAASKVPGMLVVGPIGTDYAAQRAALSNNAHAITFGAKRSETEEEDREAMLNRADIFLSNVLKFDQFSNSAQNVAAILEVDSRYRK